MGLRKYFKEITTESLTVDGQSGIEPPQNVAGSRSIGSWEQNQTGKPLLVQATIGTASTNVTDGDFIQYSWHINNTESNEVIGRNGMSAGAADNNLNVSVLFIVPKTYHYKITQDGDQTGSAAIQEWWEQTIGI